MIKAENITKIYRNGPIEFAALRDVSLHVSPGEFVGIMGRSGSGKSTLLYQMSLLDRPTSGSVTINGIDAGQLDERSRTDLRLALLGYVFQEYALLPELTAEENVALPMLMLGWDAKEARTRAAAALERVGLGAKLNNLPSMLSGGEQQRVSIARAIGHGSTILFADEPTANLDTDTAAKVMSTFRDLHHSGHTIVMVTHEDEFRAVFDRVVRLSDGRIVEGA
jgi:putative ABC transport system ATP-binding protein